MTEPDADEPSPRSSGSWPALLAAPVLAFLGLVLVLLLAFFAAGER